MVQLQVDVQGEGPELGRDGQRRQLAEDGMENCGRAR